MHYIPANFFTAVRVFYILSRSVLHKFIFSKKISNFWKKTAINLKLKRQINWEFWSNFVTFWENLNCIFLGFSQSLGVVLIPGKRNPEAELLQEGIFFLIHLFARDILVKKKLEIEITKLTFIFISFESWILNRWT